MLSTLDQFKLMLEDNSQARSPFKATDLVWTAICAEFQARIDAGGLAKLDNFNSRFAAYHPSDRHYIGYAQYMGCQETPPNWYDRAIELYTQKLKQRDVHDVLGRVDLLRDWDYLSSVEEITSILEACPRLLTEPLTIVDLGSGWGRIGHVLTHLNPRLAYVACDIPESLIVAQAHLPPKLNVPVYLYDETRGTSVFTEGVWFCGPQHLDRLADASVDVFINTFSFQEMTMTQVTEYFEVIDRVTKGGLLYTQQRKRGDQLTRENYPYRSGWKPAFDREAIFSPVYFEAALWI